MGQNLDEFVNQVLLGDSREVLRRIPDCSVDAVCTDPPSGIVFMGREWDDPNKLHTEGSTDRDKFVNFLTEIMRECFRVLKPGGHAIVWSIPRTAHWTALALENAGFEYRDTISHIFGCLSEDTEILTERGWVSHTTLKEGIKVLGFDCVDGTFSWQPIQEVVTYPYAETAYRLVGEQTDQIVSKNHRCLIKRDEGLVFEFAEDLPSEVYVPVIPGPVWGFSHKEGGTPIRPWLSVETVAVKVEPIPYTGTVWCVRVPTGAFVARRHEKVFITGNSGFPKSLSISKALTKMGASPEDVKKWDGWGTSLKPAYEPWHLYKKPLHPGVYPATYASTTVLLEAYLWSISPAKFVAWCSESNKVEQSVGCVSVRWLAFVQSITESPEKFAQTGMFTSPEVVSTYWNIVSSWSAILDVVLGQESTSTIKMGNETTTALRTLNSYLSRHTDTNTLQHATRNGGLWSRVSDAESNLTVKSVSWRHIPQPSVPEGVGNNTIRTVLSLLADIATSLSAEITEVGSASTVPSSVGGRINQPSVELGALCRKPIEEKNVASQVLATGTGALNIDGTRIGASKRVPGGLSRTPGTSLSGSVDGSLRRETGAEGGHNPNIGRWPSNVLLSHLPSCKQVGTKTVPAPVINRFTDGMKPFGEGAGHPYESSGGGTEEMAVYECDPECMVRKLDEQSGVLTSGTGSVRSRPYSGYHGGDGVTGQPEVTYGDSGGASRFFKTFEPTYDVPFFYTGKASKADKNDGIEEMMAQAAHRIDEQTVSTASNRKCRVCGYVKFGQPHCECPEPEWEETDGSKNANFHPTVKSTKLMAYLVKLVCPKGGLVLDPFAGSGSTLVSAIQEGMDFIGIEKEPEYHKIASARVGANLKRAEEKQVATDIWAIALGGDDE